MIGARGTGLIGVLLLIGCSGAPTSSKKPPAPNTESGVSAVDRAEAIQFASAFLGAAKDGSARPDRLSPGFLKVIAEPVFPSDRERGYSTDEAAKWLKTAGARQNVSLAILKGIDAQFAYFETNEAVLRLARGQSGWQVDWYHTGRPRSAAAIPENTTADDLARTFAAIRFLDPLFTGNLELTEAAMTASRKTKLAPPLGSDPRGYNRGTLRGKLKDILNGATGYTLNISGNTVTVNLTGGGQRILRLALSSDGSLVDSFEWQ